MWRHREGHRGRVFYSYLLSFFLILLVPVVISFFVFHRAQSIVSEEVERANNALQTQVSKYLDLVMENSQQLNHLVVHNNRLESLLYDTGPVEGEEYFRAWQLVQDFETYRVMTTGAVNFYVYIRALDMVVSPEGYYTTRNYHIARRQFDPENYETWLASLRAVSHFAYRPGRVAMVPILDDEWVQSLELVTPLPLGQRGDSPRGWLVIQVNDEPFRRPFAGTEWDEQSIFLVHHKPSGLISSSDPRVSAQVLRENDLQLPNADAESTIELFGTTYMAISTPSTVSNWTYTSLVPADVYMSRFVQLRSITLLALVLCGLIGGASIYAISIARYRPIHELLSIVAEEKDGNISLRSDEFQMIRTSFETTLAEDRALRQQVIEAKPLVLQRLLLQLLRGTVRYDRDMERRLASLGLQVSRGDCTTGVVRADEPRPLLWQYVAEASEAGFDQDHVDAKVVREIDGAVAIVVLHDHLPKNTLDHTFNTLKKSIENRLDCECAFGVSDAHPLAHGLEHAYQEAVAALEYRLVRGGSAPVFYSEVLVSGESYDYPMEVETKLINSIALGSFDEAREIVDSVFEANFSRPRLSIEMARCLMFDLISTMVKTLNRITPANGETGFWSQLEPISRLTRCHSLEELHGEMTTMLRQVCGRIRSAHTPHSEQLRDQMLRFIEEHLSDKNLSPDLVATRLGKNSAYLARFFREEMQVGMSSYIKRCRVERAKRRLAEDNPTIREIAEGVGFVDSNAMIRAFKATEGLTPGEFRESVQLGIPNGAQMTTRVQE